MDLARALSLLPVGLLSLAAPGDRAALDQVALKNGNLLEGWVVYEDPQALILRTGTRDRELRMRDVVKVDSRARHLREGFERWRHLAPRDTRKMLDLAAFYTRVGLDEEARLIAWYVLTLEPNNEVAHEALRHERRGDRWYVRTESGSVPFHELDGLHSRWEDAWEIPTAHYRVRTNLPLADAITVALDLEGLYRSFFDRFGADLRLYEVIEPMSAHVYADRSSFPEKLMGRFAFYETDTNTLVLDASLGLGGGLLFHEATHQLLNCTARHARRAPGEVPAWVDEGLAEYIRAGMTGLPGRAVFREGQIARHHFQLHARTSEPYSLQRMFGFASTDFEVSTDPDLKYAQAYTFVNFCLHADGGKYRHGFLQFLRGTYRGKSSPTHFREALGVGLDELDKSWLLHVRTTSGVR